MKKPDFIDLEHLKYLNFLEESGQIDMSNMFEVSVHLRTDFPELSTREIRKTWDYWRENSK